MRADGTGFVKVTLSERKGSKNTWYLHSLEKSIWKGCLLFWIDVVLRRLKEVGQCHGPFGSRKLLSAGKKHGHTSWNVSLTQKLLAILCVATVFTLLLLSVNNIHFYVAKLDERCLVGWHLCLCACENFNNYKTTWMLWQLSDLWFVGLLWKYDTVSESSERQSQWAFTTIT